MNIQCTYKGETVNIIDIKTVGQNIAISYIDSSNILHVDMLYKSPDGAPLTIATGCVII